MVDEKKLKLMTYMAREESKSELRNAIITVRAYRSDYLIKHGIFAFIMGSIVFMILAAIYAIFNLERFTTMIFTNEFMQGFNSIIVKYGVFITVFIGINILVYNFKYSVSYRRFIAYRKLQKKLIKLNLEGEKDD